MVSLERPEVKILTQHEIENELKVTQEKLREKSISENLEKEYFKELKLEHTKIDTTKMNEKIIMKMMIWIVIIIQIQKNDKINKIIQKRKQKMMKIVLNF